MVSLITAVDKNGLIGKNGQMPWHLPEEMKFFKETTLGSTVVMGRKTFESLGKPLKGRKNVVLTRDASWSHPDVTVVRHENDVLALAHEDEIMVIGGRQVYELFLPHADFIIQSVVEGDYTGDTYFPELEDDWVVLAEENHKGFVVKVYVRRITS